MNGSASNGSAAPDGESRDAPSVGPALPVGQAPSVLIVDDLPANLLAFEAVLDDLGARVVRAASGAEALRVLTEQEVALVLLDVQMPDLSGLEVARWMRGRPSSRATPIIFVTALDRDDRAMSAAYALGAVDFLFKPVLLEILRAKVGAFLDLARQRELVRQHERRAHLRELNEARQSWEIELLQETAHRREEFLAVLGHELRNPLGALTTGMDLLHGILERNPSADPAASRTRDVMAKQVAQLARLVDDLLDTARMESGKLQLCLEPTCIQDVLNQAAAVSRPQMEAQGHHFEMLVPSDRVSVRGDAVRLVQVVSNLLSNAARYTPPGGNVRLCCEVPGDQVEIRVEDDGLGIDPRTADQLFEPFVQGTSDTSRGLGLGLPIVKSLVVRHGGTVELQSAGLGRGTRAVVRLPLRGREHVPSTMPPPRSAPRSDRRLSVVVVDDNHDLREMAQALLVTEGHSVAVAGDGATGVDLIIKVRAEVAIIDLGLPDMDGHGVAIAVRETMGRAIRLIALTGRSEKSERLRATESGFDALLVKPAPAEVLLAAIHGDDGPQQEGS